jgi:hypothetical protein
MHPIFGLAAVLGFIVGNVSLLTLLAWRRERPASLRQFLGH